MSPHREEHIDLCAALALGSIEEADRTRLESHLADGCAECAAALDDFGGAVMLVAASAPSAMPRPELKRRVMSLAAAESGSKVTGDSRAHETGPDGRRVIEMRPRRTAPPFFMWGVTAAAAALAIAVGVMWNNGQRLERDLVANRTQLEDLRHRLDEEQQWSNVLNAPGARFALLAPTPQGAPDLRARATFDPATRRAVLVFENVQAPAGHDYELWAINTAGPASLGLVKADAHGRAVLHLENVADPAALGAFALSLELTGGSPTPNAPTGPVVAVGRLGG